MVVDANTITTADLAAHSIDFVEQFSFSVQALLTALGHVNMRPMASNSVIQTYKAEVNSPANRTVAEGEVIPLTKVSRTKDKEYKLALTDKLRKTTTFEAIQQNGFDNAVNFTDAKLLNVAQANAKSDLFDALNSKGTTTANGATFQAAIAAGLGKLVSLFEDVDGVGATVAFVNPEDLYEYVGGAQITTQTAFGLQYLQNFVNVNSVVMSNKVPKGKVLMTVDNNLNFYYVDMRGEAGRAFNMQIDGSGLIGATHTPKADSLSYETVAAGGWLILPERTDGIVASTISAAANGTAATAASK